MGQRKGKCLEKAQVASRVALATTHTLGLYVHVYAIPYCKMWYHLKEAFVAKQYVTLSSDNQHHPVNYDHEPRQVEWEGAATWW